MHTDGRRAARTYPELWSAPVWDDVMDVPVVAEAQGGTAHQRAHVQGEDGDEQRLPALQVAVQQNGHKNNLVGGKAGAVRGKRQWRASCLLR